MVVCLQFACHLAAAVAFVNARILPRYAELGEIVNILPVFIFRGVCVGVYNVYLFDTFLILLLASLLAYLVGGESGLRALTWLGL